MAGRFRAAGAKAAAVPVGAAVAVAAEESIASARPSMDIIDDDERFPKAAMLGLPGLAAMAHGDAIVANLILQVVDGGEVNDLLQVVGLNGDGVVEYDEFPGNADMTPVWYAFLWPQYGPGVML